MWFSYRTMIVSYCGLIGSNINEIVTVLFQLEESNKKEEFRDFGAVRALLQQPRERGKPGQGRR